jgi:signal transduction histidine kinase
MPSPTPRRGRSWPGREPAWSSAAYFLVSEALSNVAKYARATAISVALESSDGEWTVSIADDGVGGAGPERGSGLRGLVDRVQATGGDLEIVSPRGEGTRLRARFPTHVLESPNGF